MENPNLKKVVLAQQNDDNIDIETPWAEDLGNNQYKLKNFPFYFYGLSFDDVFEATRLYDDDERPYFTKVIKKSGHKTVRVIFNESANVSEMTRQTLKTLQNMGCGYEGNDACFYTINIQPHCDFWKVCEYLTESDVEWEHADPTYYELYPE